MCQKRRICIKRDLEKRPLQMKHTCHAMYMSLRLSEHDQLGSAEVWSLFFGKYGSFLTLLSQTSDPWTCLRRETYIFRDIFVLYVQVSFLGLF